MKIKNYLLEPEMLIPTAAFLLALSGVLTVSSTAQSWSGSSELAMRQLGHIAVAVILMFSVSRIPFPAMTRRGTLIFIGVAGWLFLAGLWLFGSRINGMCGWYRCGNFSVQPAEVIKPLYLLITSVLLTRKGNLSRNFYLAAGFTILWLIPVALQPDSGTAAIYLSVFFLLAIASGSRTRDICISGAVIAVPLAILLWRTPYAIRRISAFFSPVKDQLGDNWHVMHFELAVSRGSWFGSNLGKAIWSNAYLPFADNDSAYATLSETLGFVGVIVIFALFFVLIGAMFKLSRKPELSREAGFFIASGATLIAVQALTHISINLALIPPSGLTFPFISYGGSSLSGFALLLAMALAAGRGNSEIAKD